MNVQDRVELARAARAAAEVHADRDHGASGRALRFRQRRRARRVRPALVNWQHVVVAVFAGAAAVGSVAAFVLTVGAS